MALLQSNTIVYGTANVLSVLSVGASTANIATNPNTGALIVTGGAGISGNIYSGGLISANGSISANSYITANGYITATGSLTASSLAVTGAVTGASSTITGTSQALKVVATGTGSSIQSPVYLTTANANTTVSGTYAVDLSQANYFKYTITGSTVFTFINPSTSAEVFVMVMANGGSYSITWPSTVRWPGGTVPTLTTTGTDVLVFSTDDSGSNYRGVATQINSM